MDTVGTAAHADPLRRRDQREWAPQCAGKNDLRGDQTWVLTRSPYALRRSQRVFELKIAAGEAQPRASWDVRKA